GGCSSGSNCLDSARSDLWDGNRAVLEVADASPLFLRAEATAPRQSRKRPADCSENGAKCTLEHHKPSKKSAIAFVTRGQTAFASCCCLWTSPPPFPFVEPENLNQSGKDC